MRGITIIVQISAVVLSILMLLSGCVPTKQVTTSENYSASDIHTNDSLSAIQTRTLDLLLRRLTETKEQLSEWTTERVEYNTIDYDTLGRIIRSTAQTTDRQGGRHNDRHIVDNTTASITMSQIDSLILSSEKRIMSKIATKSTIETKKGIPAWQKGLMIIGIISLCYIVIKILFKTVLRPK